jgi:hypothetical protein
MDLEMDKEVVFPSSGPYHSQQFDHSHFLLFKIIASTVAANIGKGTNTRREKGALNLKPHMTGITFFSSVFLMKQQG